MNYTLAGSRGIFALAGHPATLTQSAQTFTSYQVTGNAVILAYGRLFPAATGAFTLSGQSASIGRSLAAAAGSFSLSARPATLFPSLRSGAFIHTGNSAGIRAQRSLAFAAGAYALAANAASFAKGRRLTAERGAFLLALPGAWFLPPLFPTSSGTFTIGLNAADLNHIQSTRIYRKQTTINWPADLLGCQLRAGYSVGVAPMFDRTTIAEAPPAFRRNRVDERRSHSVEFIWNLSQLSAFETFYNDTLNKGMRWFMMEQITDGRLRHIYCHIAEGYTLTPQPDRPDLYRVAFSVMGYWRVAKSPEWI